MRADTEIRRDGMRTLTEVLGPVEAERFVTLMLREPFDYTKWQRDLWAKRTVDELSAFAMEHGQSRSQNQERQE